MVGETRFELATLCSQSRCATRLRYSPTRTALVQAGGTRQGAIAKSVRFVAHDLVFINVAAILVVLSTGRPVAKVMERIWSWQVFWDGWDALSGAMRLCAARRIMREPPRSAFAVIAARSWKIAAMDAGSPGAGRVVKPTVKDKRRPLTKIETRWLTSAQGSPNWIAGNTETQRKRSEHDHLDFHRPHDRRSAVAG